MQNCRTLFRLSKMALKFNRKPIYYRPVFHFAAETHQFKAETKKLLDIVAKSLYTDKDVFLRELLSNASDALEKQRFISQTQSGEDVGEQLEIRIELDENKRTITIEDTGVGMTKEEMIQNLGTIAHSGSKQFLLSQEKNQDQLKDKLIGQFGVGFYSAFIVGDTVEVKSRSMNSSKTYVWVSDGTGEFEISESNDNSMLYRGTQIVIHLKPECEEFARKATIDKTIQRYSNFISFPISINDEKQNLVQAIWTRNKQDIKPEEYNKFFEYISKSKLAYKYLIHYSTDAPLAIKALLYIPSSHMEKFGMEFEEFELHLYCKKVLIKSKCREILPNYLRFVKGVVDCEDLPLNISREHYQDSNLILKLKQILTRRILSELNNQANRDAESYMSWYNEFQYFLKEGVASDHENQEQILKLLRFQTNKSNDFISLDQYVEMLPKDADTIYFLLAPSREHAISSPYMEPFQNSDIPIILTYMHIDEMVFKGVEKFKNYKFQNIESNQEELQKNFKPVEHDQSKGLSNDQLTPLCMWLKNELSPVVNQVTISKRLQNSPAIIVSPLSSGMRQVMSMLDKSQVQQYTQNLTLEINPNHETIIQLNKLRSQNNSIASLVSKQIVDNCMMTAGLISDPKKVVDRINNLLNIVMQKSLNQEEIGKEQVQEKAQREELKEEKKENLELNDESEIQIDEDGTPRIVKKK